MYEEAARGAPPATAMQHRSGPALRGPAFSSQPPQIAAEEPSSTKNSVYIQPRSATFQSQEVVKSEAISPTSAGQATGLLMPIAWLSGSQNTEKP